MVKVNRLMELESLYEKCASGHPHVSTNSPGLYGIPHIKKTTVEVSEVLSRLYVHGSIPATVKYYDDPTEEQIKDALAFAGRFMELACNALWDSE